MTARGPNIPISFRPTARTMLSLSSLNSSDFFAETYKVWIMNEDKTVEFNLPRDPSTEAHRAADVNFTPAKESPERGHKSQILSADVQ